MSPSRRSRVAALAAALIATLLVGGVAGMAGTALAAGDLDCSDSDFREEAQAALDAGGGVACESLPGGGADAEDAADDDNDAPATTPAAAPIDDEDGDRDCADFATQAEAQAALSGSSGDPERLDTDDDGIACEEHFGTDGRQVAVNPQGGVATGGSPRP